MTTASPFKAGPEVAPRGFLARLFRVGAKADARQALINALAVIPPATLGASAVTDLLRAHGVRRAQATELLEAVWRDALHAFLADDEVSDAEVAYLNDLRHALSITAPRADALFTEAASARYQAEVQDVLADNRITPDERSRLDRLVAGLRLALTERDRIDRRAAQAAAERLARGAASDERVTPEELASIDAIGRALGIHVNLSEATKAMVSKYHLFWLIDQGQLPALDADINLQRGESAYFRSAAEWLEMRTRTVRVNYAGTTASIRIMKGVHYRVGSIRPQRITQDELTSIDTGRVTFTNKRVIFEGGKKNTSIRLSALLGFEGFADGLKLEKATGRHPYLRLAGDAEVAGAILGALLAQD